MERTESLPVELLADGADSRHAGLALRDAGVEGLDEGHGVCARRRRLRSILEPCRTVTLLPDAVEAGRGVGRSSGSVGREGSWSAEGEDECANFDACVEEHRKSTVPKGIQRRYVLTVSERCKRQRSSVFGCKQAELPGAPWSGPPAATGFPPTSAAASDPIISCEYILHHFWCSVAIQERLSSKLHPSSAGRATHASAAHNNGPSVRKRFRRGRPQRRSKRAAPSAPINTIPNFPLSVEMSRRTAAGGWS
jgi:hypothetical protein